ncbi:BgTH12-03932 [Blumeria graminis f. sp. triticale]|uniref:BgTH12-03932 n=1 Tax=Blumeria graminis f. sp. triticale TaxID=1689686 RepID=A0A9W4DHR9_BLUGR|nr:BgTH12-03932 [Blumeria graminis f. sp. triticale]
MACCESMSLDSMLSPFDPVVTAVKEALKAALSLPTARFSENIWILTDELEVARLLFQCPICSSQVVFQQIQSLSAPGSHASLPGKSRLTGSQAALAYWATIWPTTLPRRGFQNPRLYLVGTFLLIPRKTASKQKYRRL